MEARYTEVELHHSKLQVSSNDWFRRTDPTIEQECQSTAGDMSLKENKQSLTAFLGFSSSYKGTEVFSCRLPVSKQQCFNPFSPCILLTISPIQSCRGTRAGCFAERGGVNSQRVARVSVFFFLFFFCLYNSNSIQIIYLDWKIPLTFGTSSLPYRVMTGL